MFDVYLKNGLTPAKAKGNYITDKDGTTYLDCYGGHGVISIGHNHSHWTQAIKKQLESISFYSNAVNIPEQEVLSGKLSTISGYPNYSLFLVNSGAEANENALKIAAFHTQRDQIISFNGSFHGRTSGAMAVSANSVKSPFNAAHKVKFFDLDNDLVFDQIFKEEAAAVIIEGIQGIAGVVDPGTTFFKRLREACTKSNTVLILDEVQSGFGRTGEFFAHTNSGIKADVITMAKGMGNGFPVGGVLINPDIQAKAGMLGTTFGGNHLACVAASSVIDVLVNQELLKNAQEVGDRIIDDLKGLNEIKDIRGRGLMLGIELSYNTSNVRKKLLESGIVTGSSSNANVFRILPPLTLNAEEAKRFSQTLKSILQDQL